MSSSDALQALFYPFDTSLLPRPQAGQSVLFINAQHCPGLMALVSTTVTAQQSFRPAAAALAQAGFSPVTEIPEDLRFDLVLIAGAKQHQENMFLIAAGLKALKSGGTFICAAANDAGGKRLVADLAEFGLTVQSESKFKCRIVVAQNVRAFNAAAVNAALAAGNYQPVMNGDYISRPGVFCWDRIDKGSALLAAQIDFAVLSGRGADFGCGYGFLSRQVALQSPSVDTLYCIEADGWALESCRRTLAQTKVSATQYIWADIPEEDDLPRNLDWIVMNPPFHAGKATLPRIGIAFIERAAQSLRKGGILWMVANAGLPYESVLAEHFARVERLQESGGYKIYKAEK